MKKCLALLLVLSMAFSLFVVPASADEASNSVIWKDTIDMIPDNTNIFYESESSAKPTSKQYDVNGGILVSLQSANYNITSNSSRIGTFDNSAETKTITGLTNFFGYQGAIDTLQDRYADGQQFIIGTALGATYNGTNSSTTGTYIAGQPFKGAALTKVKDPDNAENYVLKYDFGQTGSNKASGGMSGGVYTRLKAGAETAITTVDGATHTANGKMVYEWKVRVPSATIPLFQHKTTSNHISLGGIMANNGYSRLLRDTVYTKVNSDGTYELRVEYKVSDLETGENSFPHIVLSADTWHSFKQVISVDDTALSTGRPIIEAYFDGEKVGTYRATDEDSKFVMKGSAAAGWTTGLWCAGIGPDATGDAAIDANNMIIYYDDIKQYWLSDTLTVSGIADSYTEFAAKDTVEVTYSQAADFDALEKAISVTKDGADAGVTVTVTSKDECTALISFSGLDMTDENTYNVTISEFADIFGNKNTTPKTFTITTKAAGKMKVIPSVSYIYGYEAGMSNTFTITTEYKADLANIKFYLMDEDGNAVAELTPSVDATGMILTFDLKDAELEDKSANYTFVSEGYFTQDGGDAINGDVISIPVSVVSYSYQGEALVNCDFDEDTKDTNWLTTSSAISSGWGISWRHQNTSRGSYGLNGNGVHSFIDGSCTTCGTSYDYADNYLTDYFVGVVSDPKNSDNNVIKYQAGKYGDGLHYARVHYKVDKIIDTSKNLVLSSKILLTEELKKYMADRAYNDLPVVYTYNYDSDNFTRAQFKAADDGLVLTANDGFTTTLKTDEWFELKYVILPTTTVTETKDESGNVTEVTYDQWTYMVYINDVLIDVKEKTVFKGNNGSVTVSNIKYTGGFATTQNKQGLTIGGVSFGILPNGNGETTPTFYVDDVKLYQPEKTIGTYAFAGTSVIVSYNNVLSKTSASDVVITNEFGEVLENAANSVSVGTDGKSVIIALNTDVIAPSSVYSVSGLTDAFGQKVATVTFTTPKSYVAYTESGIADTSVSGKVSVPVKVENASGNPVQAVLVVAVYNSDYEMIGASSVVFGALDSDGYNDTVDVDITGYSASDIKSIKVHLWDSVAGMQPYQTAELVSF